METLDLCLSCKACKAECPTNVDIARLKAEYSAQRHRSNRPPLRDLAFGHIHTLNRLACITPGLSNALSRFGPTRAIMNRFLGLDPRRSLPPFAKPLHRRWPLSERGAHATRFPEAPGSSDQQESGRSRSPHRDNAPLVVLYADTFTTHNEPEIGLAARRVLHAFGYRVELFRGSDASRALMSVGLLPAAVRRIDRETRALLPVIDRAEAVLFLEPSCLSAVTDDWPALKCETPAAARRRLAEHCRLVEQFLADRWDEHPTRPATNKPANEPPAQAGGPDEPTPSRPVHEGSGGAGEEREVPSLARGARSLRQPEAGITLHAHCHQKALWGPESSAALLERLFPGRVRVADTTCCGLAGSFGYTRERFDLSMRIGELGVLPEARDAEIFVAPGTSCRHQVKDGAGARALHPVELIDRQLAKEPQA